MLVLVGMTQTKHSMFKVKEGEVGRGKEGRRCLRPQRRSVGGRGGRPWPLLLMPGLSNELRRPSVSQGFFPQQRSALHSSADILPWQDGISLGFPGVAPGAAQAASCLDAPLWPLRDLVLISYNIWGLLDHIYKKVASD